ncbi:MAG: hypothetical protein ABI577_09370 [bacterium]
MTEPPGAIVTDAGLQRNAELLTPTEAVAGFPEAAGVDVGAGGAACVGAGVLPAGGLVAVAAAVGAAVVADGSTAVVADGLAVVVGADVGEPTGDAVDVPGWAVATEMVGVGVFLESDPPPQAARTAPAAARANRKVVLRIVLPLRWL